MKNKLDDTDKYNLSTKYWHTVEDGRIQCDICPRACKLHEGQRGLCFVRARVNNEVILTTYGRSSGYCIDPIEKKPLNHFLPGTPVLSFGTAGCNLSCKFCQNSDISKSREIDTLSEEAFPKTIAIAAKKLKCSSIAFTYNDPIPFMEYAIDTAKECRKLGIKTVAVSAGYICPEPRKEFFSYIDAANIDLKAFTEEFYHKITGSHLKDVLETLIYIKNETNVWLEITTLLIPGENDSDEEITAMSKWILDNLGPNVPLHFTAFHPSWRMMDKPRTPQSTLTRAREIAKAIGLNYVYTGNVHDPEGSSTYCTKCNNILIKRDWHNILQYNLSDDGLCLQCGAKCHGVFAGACGKWGSKRQLVKIG
jgi:pyruvate formate lyase activating enzyme